MSSMNDKAKGLANEAAGNVKQGFGKAIGNKQMEIEGTIQERRGEAQRAMGKAKDTVKKLVDDA